MADLTDRLNAALAGRYAIQRELGAGGMATVFLARDLKHPRLVAIKVLHPELAAAIGSERFLNEIEIVAGLSHPHILPLHDSGSAAELLYYVMPHVEGESLRARLERERQLPVKDALRVAGQVASALDYAHRRGVVHRDIKPENVLLADGQAVVADFGIARAIAAAGTSRLTATGVTLGTPTYMSPEQAMAGGSLDGRSDIYSLACVLYEMLAGQPPFTGATGESLVHQHLSVAPRPVSALRTTAPSHVDRALATALAKAPADRFGTASEFATAIAPPEPATAPPAVPATAPPSAEPVAPEPTPTPVHRRRFVPAAAAVTVAVLGIALWQYCPWCSGDRPTAPAKRAWMLVAEFDGPAADSSLVSATRDLATAGLEQSEIVAVVPDDQVELALQRAGKPASTRVDAGLARELAYRSAVRTVLEGRMGRLGKGFSVVLRVWDVDSARVVVSVSDAARDEESLIPTLYRATRRLRAELGERRAAIQSTRELLDVTTPSLEAFKVWRRAVDELFGGDNRAAITLARGALAHDPDFAAAWATIGWSFGNLGEADSATHAFRQALARPERLAENWKLACNATVDFTNGDWAGALAVSEQWVRLYPDHFGAHNNRGYFQLNTGRSSEALESFRAAERVSPFGPIQMVLVNQFYALIALARVDEARQIAPRLTGSWGLAAPMFVAAAAGEWSSAESLASGLHDNPAAYQEHRLDAELIVAAAQASRGQERTAVQTLRQAQTEAEAANVTLVANLVRWRRLMLSLFSRGVAADMGAFGPLDNTTMGLVTRGAWAAAEGDTAMARRLLATIRSRSAPEIARQGFAPALVLGWIDASAGRWQEVVTGLGPAALQGEAMGYVTFQSAPLVRWLVAEAYEGLGQSDSAAAYFERAIAPPPAGGTSFALSRMASSFGHRRLVLLYARMGRLEEAQRHWEIFTATFARPDPDMVPLVEEARVALAAATGMTKSPGR